MSEEVEKVNPTESESKSLEVKVAREDDGVNVNDVLYIGGKEIVTFNVSNITELNLVHTKQTMIDMISDYLIPKEK